MPDLLELTSSPGNTVLNIEQVLAQIGHEFKETDDPVIRESLLKLHHVSLNLVQSTLQPRDMDEFRQYRSQHYGALLAWEAADSEGLIDAEALVRITAREIAAGRMSEDDSLRKLALQGTHAEGTARLTDIPPTTDLRTVPLWRRLLSALTGR